MTRYYFTYNNHPNNYHSLASFTNQYHYLPSDVVVCRLNGQNCFTIDKKDMTSFLVRQLVNKNNYHPFNTPNLILGVAYYGYVDINIPFFC